MFPQTIIGVAHRPAAAWGRGGAGAEWRGDHGSGALLFRVGEEAWGRRVHHVLSTHSAFPARPRLLPPTILNLLTRASCRPFQPAPLAACPAACPLQEQRGRSFPRQQPWQQAAGRGHMADPATGLSPLEELIGRERVRWVGGWVRRLVGVGALEACIWWLVVVKLAASRGWCVGWGWDWDWLFWLPTRHTTTCHVGPGPHGWMSGWG